ncbi:MAG: LD-carboxypeptidase [Clostridiales bacterium]|nr:LD-carboxypeptidase [Clostridiales bacterium]
MIKGTSLTKNSTIGIIAPASKEDINNVKEKITTFSNLGFKVKLGRYIYNRHSFFAGSDLQRAKDIQDMFLDKSVQGIVCLRGGYGSVRALDYIDPNIIISNPKILCGFSDITALLNYFSSFGLITFHGPMINSDFNDKTTFNSFLNVLSTNKANYKYDLNAMDSISIINGRSFSGKIVGGNLSVLCSLIGSKYSINTANSILLLEDVNEAPYVIDRLLTQLINNNIILNCSGIIIGYLSNEKNYNKNISKFFLEKTVIDRLSYFNIPLILGFPFGHNYPNLTIPIGAYATFSYDENSLIINDSFLL